MAPAPRPKPPRPPRARTRRTGCVARALLAFVATVLLLALVLGVAAWAVFFRGAGAVEPGRPVQVAIPQGSSTREIALLLAGKGIVGNANMFRLQARVSKADGRLRAGVYELSTGMPEEVVIERLEAGPPVSYVTVTIPEGFTLDQIAARLEKQAAIPGAEFMKLAKGGARRFAEDRPYLGDLYGDSLEGYLFPKTYRFKEGTTAVQAIETMLTQFDREIAQVDLAAAKKRGLSLESLVIKASMIERETKVARERALVSSVISNRLDRGMRLEIDATIEYVLPGNRFRLRYSDLRIDSPYNTYRNKGLPVGPISNPGLASLKAAAEPARTGYLYYVLTGKDGTHTFATNEEDFLIAKRKSKEVFGR